MIQEGRVAQRGGGLLGCRLGVNHPKSWLQKDRLKPNYRLHTAELIGYINSPICLDRPPLSQLLGCKVSSHLPSLRPRVVQTRKFRPLWIFYFPFTHHNFEEVKHRVIPLIGASFGTISTTQRLVVQ